MKKTVTTAFSVLALAGLAHASHVFITPVNATSSTGGSDLWPVSNLIQGPGAGYDAADPHDALGGGGPFAWVTAAPGGFPADYIAVAGAPVITFDLGQNTDLNSIHAWGYSNSNANGVSEFSLRFATDAEGTGGFGTSISYNPTFTLPFDNNLNQTLQTNAFGQTINARYVEFTASDNFFIAPGDNSVFPPGGDRVGLGEVSFGIPEPSAGILGLLGFGLMLRRRR